MQVSSIYVCEFCNLFELMVVLFFGCQNVVVRSRGMVNIKKKNSKSLVECLNLVVGMLLKVHK